MTEFREGAVQSTFRTAESLARAVDVEMDLVAHKFEIARYSIIQNLEDAKSRPDFRAGLQVFVTAIESQLKYVERVFVLDASGKMVIDSQDTTPSARSFADQDYFVHHRESASGLIRMDQTVTPISGTHTQLLVTNRLENVDGSFGGVMAFAVSLEGMRPTLMEMRPDPESVVAIFHANALMLLRVPDSQEVEGTSFATYPLFARHLPERRVGRFKAEQQFDEQARYVAYRQNEHLPLVIAVALSEEHATGIWYEHLRIEIVKLAFVLGSILLLASLVVRSMKHRSLAAADLQSQTVEMEASRAHQRTILDALPASLVLLDSSGTVITGNANWHHFADANNYLGDDHGVGANYLTICEMASGPCSDEAAPAALGIRQVIEGLRHEFTLEYPCHAPDQLRWFRMMASAVPLETGRGAVVMHIDITSRKLAEIALEAEQSRLQTLKRIVPGVLFRFRIEEDAGFRWVALNENCLELFGVAATKVIEDNGLFAKILPPSELARVGAAFANCIHARQPLDVEFPVRGPDGKVRWIRALGGCDSPREDRQDKVCDGIFLDVSAEREAAVALEFARSHDWLTGLANRQTFLRHLERRLGNPDQLATASFAVVLIGLQNLGDINEARGMEAGDEVLKAVTKHLQDTVGSGQFLARPSGRNFALIADTATTETEASALAENIAQSFDQPLRIIGSSIRVNINIGMTICGPESERIAAPVLNDAIASLREAERKGPGAYSLNVESNDLEAQTRMVLRDGLASALENGEFELHFQPRVRIGDGAITGAEALLRWNHPFFGMQPPARFIPVAEKSGQIVQMGEWVLMEACRQARTWIESGHPDIRIAVNVSAMQLQRTDFISTVEKALSETGIRPAVLELELTESAAFDPGFGDILAQLRKLGITIAIDDFGTGFSSLSYLRGFPIDVLKIDQSFVRRMLETDADTSLVKAIIDIARALDISVTAEGVEQKEQLAILQGFNCDEVQGYFFSPPLTNEDFGWFLAEGQAQIQSKIAHASS